jgi:hypothetical protein
MMFDDVSVKPYGAGVTSENDEFVSFALLV